MSDETIHPAPPTDAAGIIAHAMKEKGITRHDFADCVGTTPEAIDAILAHEVPLPLMWVPVVADLMEYDATPLMTAALEDQWEATLTAIAVSMLWGEELAQRELVAFFTRLAGGKCPSLGDDPALAERLEKAFRAPDGSQGDAGSGQEGPVH